MNKLKDKRDKAASELAQELRYQIANNCRDDNRMYHFLIKWIQLTGKEKYNRPKYKETDIF